MVVHERSAKLGGLQPLIVGLGAVVLATLGNTPLEWFRHQLARTREGETTREAFIEEMKVLREMFSNSLSADQREETERHFLIPVNTFMPVYENTIGKIGGHFVAGLVEPGTRTCMHRGLPDCRRVI